MITTHYNLTCLVAQLNQAFFKAALKHFKEHKTLIDFEYPSITYSSIMTLEDAWQIDLKEAKGIMKDMFVIKHIKED